MKLFIGETQLCSEVKEWSVEKYGYIDHIIIVYIEKDEDGKYMDETIKGPFIVHHVDEENGSVTFDRVDPDNEYVPDGYAVTITKNIFSHKVTNVFITIMDTNIHLFPHTVTVNPEIFKMWEDHVENDNSEMYLKYHDPKCDKNIIAHVVDMFKTGAIVDYVDDGEYHKEHLPRTEKHLDMDVEIIVW
jgi:hypothetical protein